jgi:hypothetical protein
MNLLGGEERSRYFQEMVCLLVILREGEEASVLMRLDRVLDSCASRRLVGVVLGGIFDTCLALGLEVLVHVYQDIHQCLLCLPSYSTLLVCRVAT